MKARNMVIFTARLQTIRKTRQLSQSICAVFGIVDAQACVGLRFVPVGSREEKLLFVAIFLTLSKSWYETHSTDHDGGFFPTQKDFELG